MNTAINGQNIESNLYPTTLVHFSLVLANLILGGVALLFIGRQISFIPDLNPIIILSLIGTVVTLAASFFTQHYIHADLVHSPLQRYRAFCILRWALLMGGAMFSLLVLMMTRNGLPLYLFTASTLILALQYPSQKRLRAFSGV